jgi:hypothetical protein
MPACPVLRTSWIDSATQSASCPQSQIPERSPDQRPRPHRLLVIARNWKTRDFRGNALVVVTSSTSAKGRVLPIRGASAPRGNRRDPAISGPPRLYGRTTAVLYQRTVSDLVARRCLLLILDTGREANRVALRGPR